MRYYTIIIQYNTNALQWSVDYESVGCPSWLTMADSDWLFIRSVSSFSEDIARQYSDCILWLIYPEWGSPVSLWAEIFLSGFGFSILWSPCYWLNMGFHCPCRELSIWQRDRGSLNLTWKAYHQSVPPILDLMWTIYLFIVFDTLYISELIHGSN